jgi:branched-chain amino acid transport system substrate-binding protein
VRTTRWMVIAAIGASGALVASGCGSSGNNSAAKASGTVTVGFIGDLTGPAAPDQGIPQINGVKAAVQYLTSSGQIADGMTYKVVTRDSHGDPNVAAASARELTASGKVVAVIGGGSTEQEQAMQSTFARQKVVNFTSVEGTPFIDQLGIGKKYPWVFQVSETATGVVDPLLSYLSAGGKTVGELYPDSAYGQTQHAEAVKLAGTKGIKLVSKSAPPTATSYTAQLEALKGAGADGLLIWLFGPAASATMNELQQLGWAPKVAGPLGIDNTAVSGSMAKDVAGQAAAGPIPNTFLSNSGTDQLAEPALQFYENYSKLANDQAVNGRTITGTYGFDAMLLLNAAIKATKSTDPTKVRDYLDSGASIKTARGTYVYGPTKRAGVLGPEQFGVVALATPCSGGSACRKLG